MSLYFFRQVDRRHGDHGTYSVLVKSRGKSHTAGWAKVRSSSDSMCSYALSLLMLPLTVQDKAYFENILVRQIAATMVVVHVSETDLL